MDLDKVFLKINSLIERQIAEIKTTLEQSRLKKKDNDKSNPIIAELYYNGIGGQQSAQESDLQYQLHDLACYGDAKNILYPTIPLNPEKVRFQMLHLGSLLNSNMTGICLKFGASIWSLNLGLNFGV
ncbi:hypothetical protein M9H77_17306 [Catharanthus roseus]|uniref:Uncharacterized protein n=1 Tax=Catharanthus roseus TaxID=4058 RepID=A0ACC0B495_CATRO|nr:hypothetical protein M9H77_17306 [Catharanthus roseus]